MTVSLLSMLGANISLSAGSDEQGKVLLTENGDPAFDTVMAASEQQAITAEKLRDFFKAHGVELPASLEGGKAKTPGQVLADVLAAQNGKKLPGDVLVALQEILPQDFADASGLEFTAMDGLPSRELTPEELSELVQQTGLPPMVIFAALQETPAASPNLAAAMAGGMDGVGVAKVESDASMDAALQAHIIRAIADMVQKGVSRREAAQLSQQLASVDFAALNLERQDVLKRIAAVLRGEPSQGEFDLDAENLPKAAANANPSKRAEPTADLLAPKLSTTKQAADAAAQKPVQNLAPAAGNIAAAQSAEAAASVPQAGAQPASFAATLEAAPQMRPTAPVNQTEMAPRHTPADAVDVPEQVEVHLRKALADGSRRMDIHLKPAELGRVDVRIETDAQGKSHVTVTADRRETLEMLQRDARGLERALSDAGLKADSNSLSFNLRGGEGQQHAQSERQGEGKKPLFDLNGDYADDLDAKLDASELALTYDAGRAYRLNLDWGLDISV